MELDKHYFTFFEEIKSLVVSSRISAARSLNSSQMRMYWHIGKGIIERQKQLSGGKSVVEQLSKDLTKEFESTNSFSPDNLWRMRQMYKEYSSKEFLVQLVPEIKKLAEYGYKSEIKLSQEQVIPENNLLLIIQKLVEAIPWGQNQMIIRKCKEAKKRVYYLVKTSQLGWTRNVLLNQIKSKPKPMKEV